MATVTTPPFCCFTWALAQRTRTHTLNTFHRDCVQLKAARLTPSGWQWVGRLCMCVRQCCPTKLRALSVVVNYQSHTHTHTLCKGSTEHAVLQCHIWSVHICAENVTESHLHSAERALSATSQFNEQLIGITPLGISSVGRLTFCATKTQFPPQNWRTRIKPVVEWNATCSTHM